ncbi:MAG: hypothetical protein IH988_05165 [Planctomycetes bacterium]|nr:hypothetical protein [Planctomycetota bacterium]
MDSAERESLRRQAAELAERFLDGVLCLEEFWEQFPAKLYDDDAEEDADELYYEIEHEPQVGGFFGATPGEIAQRLRRIRELIAKLRADPEE